MILEIDMGNTRLKWRVRDSGLICARGNLLASEGLEALTDGLIGFVGQLRKIWVASVVSSSARQVLSLWCRENIGLEAEFASSEQVLAGVRNGYTKPELLGVDRWLALVAAYQRVRGACVVVSCGTAITVDLVNENGQHLGGYIAPGFRLLAQSLNQQTSQIEVCCNLTAYLGPGIDTQAAVDAASAAMVKGVIANALREIKELAPETSSVLVLTGGDAEVVQVFFPQALLSPDLVQDGLAFAFQ